MRTLTRAPHEVEFAHPFEQEFARLLDYYRIKWSYEPTSFTLSWSADGRPSEMFTPDFYLPDHQLYIELTTMRQRLVTRKHRKLRRLRQLYPDVRVKLLYRRDQARFLAAARHPSPRLDRSRIGKVLFSTEQIQKRIDELAQAIEQRHADLSEDRRLVVCSVGRGSTPFVTELTASLEARGLVVERDRIDLTRYRTALGARQVRLRRAPRTSIADRHLLLVADVISTGCTLDYVVRWLRKRGAASIEICTLLDRVNARLVELPIHFVAFEAPDELLVGYGLDLRRQFRDLPYLATLEDD